MSAGVCIMNKSAIALAADSAVTIGAHLAIHNSANKLFSLSKYSPVGAVVYSSAEFMKIPIETILKMFKTDLFNIAYDSLDEYVERFLVFLADNSALFLFHENEPDYIKRVYIDLLNGLFGDYQQQLRNKISAVQRELTNEEQLVISNRAVDQTLGFVDSFPNLNNFNEKEYIKNQYGDQIRTDICTKYKWIPRERVDDLINKICEYFDKEHFREGFVGLAVAGFGNKDIFPRMIHLHLAGFINGKVRYAVKEKVSITADRQGTITPFAQTDVMQTFLFGINSSLLERINQEIPRQIQGCLNGI